MGLIELIIGSTLVGGLTGFVMHLLTNKEKMIKPRNLDYSIEFGFWADVIYGAVAALFSVTYLLPTPQDPETLIAYSILAGLSAQSVLLKKRIDTESSKHENGQSMEQLENETLTVEDDKPTNKDEER
ncbi:DUF4257 domain-containing protein [Pontibacillus halophilus]|uniref:DUF4257 domain-containing protein n=1 Tax=Pontibacillus halophilus TaxID=516704 RepID=UPI0003FE057E|nr:DUF4257 domain-containing protein [Pontibacillus halophilus]